jgi:hypothetical protein
MNETTVKSNERLCVAVAVVVSWRRNNKQLPPTKVVEEWWNGRAHAFTLEAICVKMDGTEWSGNR